MSFKFTAPILRISSEFQRNPLTHTPYQWGRKALHDYWLKGFFWLLLAKGILNFADWILYFVFVHCFFVVSVKLCFISPFFLMQQKLNVLNECLCTALPVLCHIKWLDLSFHLKNRKCNEVRKEKALLEVEQSFKGKQESGSSCPLKILCLTWGRKKQGRSVQTFAGPYKTLKWLKA